MPLYAAVIFGLVQICLGSTDACFPDIPAEEVILEDLEAQGAWKMYRSGNESQLPPVGLQDFEEAGRGTNPNFVLGTFVRLSKCTLTTLCRICCGWNIPRSPQRRLCSCDDL